MSKFARLGVIATVLFVSVMGVVAVQPRRVEAVSSACTEFAAIGPQTAGGISSLGAWTFEAGETILVTATGNVVVPRGGEQVSLLGGSSVFLEVDGAVVDWALNVPPVTLSYTFPADGDYSWSFYTNLEAQMVWETDCIPGPVAGCDLTLFMPEWAVVGQFTDNTVLEWTPGETTDTVVEVGKTAWVLGVNEAGTHYLIYWGCIRAWVPVGNMGPNYDAVWNGTPLPTHVMD